MEQPALTLYHFPGACSNVSVCALEAAGLGYDLKLIDIRKGEQSEESYLRTSPLGKVPLLMIDGMPLAENAAILTYIDALRPDMGVLPRDPSPRMRADIVGGMSLCGGTLHPTIRGIVNPQRVTDSDKDGVRSRSIALATKYFAYVEERLAERIWWLGEISIIDVYIDWAFTTACKGGFEGSACPTLSGLSDRLAVHMPGYARMVDINRAATARLDDQ